MGPIRSERLQNRNTAIRYAVLRKEPQRCIQPFPAPSLPSKASTLARPTQMAPNPLFYPVSDKEKHRLAWPIAKYFTQPRRIGLILSITPPTDWEREPG